MARYIDADATLKSLPDDLPYKASVKRVLAQAPTADVVEVVRCKDCKWAEQVMIGRCVNWICKCPWMFERYVRGGFCSYGERKEGAE
jgi:hypothetical protein